MMNKVTVVGPTVVIRGKLRTEEDLVVKGRIEAEITSSKLVQVDKEGIVKADIAAESLLVSGLVVGSIHVGTRVEVTADGRVVGDITTPILVLHEGARVRGKVDMPEVEQAMEKEPVDRAQETQAWEPVRHVIAPPPMPPLSIADEQAMVDELARPATLPPPHPNPPTPSMAPPALAAAVAAPAPMPLPAAPPLTRASKPTTPPPAPQPKTQAQIAPDAETPPTLKVGALDLPDIEITDDGELSVFTVE